MQELLEALRATAESTRLRIMAALDRTELTVGELCRVLDQSQPRVSRHLKLLCDAGLLIRHAEGTSAFYRPAVTGTGQQLASAVLALVDQTDPIFERDAHRLAVVRAERAEAAERYFESIATNWDDMRQLHVADNAVEAAMLEAVADLDINELLDIGTGTGRVLEIFAPSIRRGVGLDLSSKMLNLARSRLDQAQLRHCSVQHGSAYDIERRPGSVDAAVLHHVLHFLDDPAEAIAQAGRTLRPFGRLVIVDFGPHQIESLRTELSHRRLGFTTEEITAWCEAAGLTDLNVRHMNPIETHGNPLTVSIWVASQQSDAPAVYPLEAAS